MNENKNTLNNNASFTFIPKEERNIDEIKRPSISFWKDAFRRFTSNKIAMIALITLIIIVLLAIFVPMFSKFSYDAQDLRARDQGPSLQHLFGTDKSGRDTFVRVWYGARYTMSVGIVTMIIALFIGVIYGGIAGYLGGIVDNIMLRIVDVIISVPITIYVILLTVWLKATFPESNNDFMGMIVALSFTSWLLMARIVRAEVLQLKQQEFVLAAKTLGANGNRILFRHLIPNSLGSILVAATLIIPSAIFTESFLGFIGLGISAPKASLGTLCSDAINSLVAGHLSSLLAPAAVISVIILCFNLIGDGLRDALDPKLRK